MLAPSHGLKLAGMYCVPAAVLVSTSSANSNVNSADVDADGALARHSKYPSPFGASWAR